MEIQERSSRRIDLLQQAHCNAQIFGDDEVELMNWLTEVLDKLSKLSVQDYSTDVLTRQHTELLVFYVYFVSFYVMFILFIMI